MIIGIGIDRMSVERIRSAHSRFQQRFVDRLFTKDEQVLIQKKHPIERRLAMFFAAKEAVSKALGTGFAGVSPLHIEVVYHDSGKPGVRLHASAAAVASRQGISKIHLSLSDDEGVAMAFAVAEGESIT